MKEEIEKILTEEIGAVKYSDFRDFDISTAAEEIEKLFEAERQIDIQLNKDWFNEFMRIQDATFDLWRDDIDEKDGTLTILRTIERLRASASEIEEENRRLREAIKTAHGFLLDYSLIVDKNGSVERAKNALENL